MICFQDMKDAYREVRNKQKLGAKVRPMPDWRGRLEMAAEGHLSMKESRQSGTEGGV